MFKSCGTGKSRLAQEAGKYYLGFPFVLGDTDYPLRNIAIAKYLEEPPKQEVGSIHSGIRAAVFISAVLSIGKLLKIIVRCYS